MSDFWAIIPARGGSQGIPRKNLVACAGKPLIQHVVDVSIEVAGRHRVVVITDDVEIEWFVSRLGVRTILEPEQSGPLETLDEKIVRNVPKLRGLGAVDDDVMITIQPTSPLVGSKSLQDGFQKIIGGAGSVISVVPDSHLTWAAPGLNRSPAPMFEKRANRQEIPPVFRETGGMLGARLGDIEAKSTRVIDPVELVVVSESEGIDIDSYGDLFEAEHWLTRGKVVIRADAGAKRGMGHLYRGLAVAQELSRHEVILAMSGDFAIVGPALRSYPYRVVRVEEEEDFLSFLASSNPDLLIADILDSTAAQVNAWRDAAPRAKIITFEDEGSGAKHCDARVYDLTAPISDDGATIHGIRSSILAPSFEIVSRWKDDKTGGSRLLVTFGGSDPSRLTEKVLDALELLGHRGPVTVVSGIGAAKPDLTRRNLNLTFFENVTNMALLMAEHTLAVSSMGRTVFELATCGVPVLCFAQNEKEAAHVHVGQETGSVFGGLGYSLSTDEIASTVRAFLEDTSLHETLRSESAAFKNDRSNRKALLAALGAVGMGHLASVS